jgi:hypothetical protein
VGSLPVSEPSLRKPAGVALMLVGIGVWAVIVVSLVEALDLPGWAEAIAYLAGGIAWLWVLPMKRLLLWMETGRWR